MAKGGARQGAGRKSLAEEQQTALKARKAIIAKYKSIEGGLEHLLDSDEPQLVKWVFEHALGKPVESVEIDGEVSHELTFKVIRGNKDRSTGK